MYKQQRHLEVRLNKDSKYSYFSNLHIRKESKPVLEQLPRRKIAPNFKTNLNPNPNPNRGYFSSGAIVWLPPNPKINPNLDPNPNPNQGGGWFSSGCNCPDTVKTILECLQTLFYEQT